LLPIALIFVIFYFLLIRPQKKAQEEHKKMIAQLKKNDEVTTSGGIYGTVMNVKDKTVTLKVDDNVKIEVLRSAIATVRRRAGE
jgi:preprotein translocase subunit YajC